MKDLSMLGTNLGKVEFWDPFTLALGDAMRGSEGFKANGQCMVWGNQPDTVGDYAVSWSGNGNVVVTMGGSISGGVLRATRGPLVIKRTGDVRDIQIRRAPGHLSPAFVKAVAPAGLLRLMNPLRINNSTQRRWSDRCTLDAQTWGQDNGTPWEIWLEHAATTGVDLWICVPHMADDDYVRQLALLVRQIIGDRAIRIYWADSNEVWNWQFAQAKWQEAQAKARKKELRLDDDGKSGDELRHRFHALRTLQIARIVRSAFGESDKRMRPVLEAFIGNYAAAADALAWLQRVHGASAIGELFSISIANYWGSTGFTPAQARSWTAERFAANALAAAKRFGTSASNSTTGIVKYKTLCDKLGLTLTAYEGGVDFGQGSAGVQAKAAAQLLPAVAESIAIAYDWWFAKLGAGEANYYKLVSLWNEAGVWGLFDRFTQPGRKYDAWAAACATHRRVEDEGTAPAPPPLPPVDPKQALRAEIAQIDVDLAALAMQAGAIAAACEAKQRRRAEIVVLLAA